MNNILKDFQEEQDKEFGERFYLFNRKKHVKGNEMFFAQKKVKSYIHSREEALLKRIREDVKKMRKGLQGDNCSCHIDTPCSSCQELDIQEVETYNNALDDIKNLLI